MGLSGGVGLFMQAFSLADTFRVWESFGIFDLLLPFLLIFCIIFGVLSTTRILGSNNGINLIIAMVIALMSLRLEFVSLFFTVLFPKFAMGLASIVVGIILVGLFIPQEKKTLKTWYTFFGVAGVIIALISIIGTFSEFDYFGSRFWQEYITIIISAVVIVAVLVTVVITTGKVTDQDPDRWKPYVMAPHRPE